MNTTIGVALIFFASIGVVFFVAELFNWSFALGRWSRKKDVGYREFFIRRIAWKKDGGEMTVAELRGALEMCHSETAPCYFDGEYWVPISKVDVDEDGIVFIS